VYLNTIDGAFVFDDHHEVVENTSIRNLSDIRAVLRRYPTRPLTNLSYAVDYARTRLDPRGYHITNITLHALNVSLLFVVTATIVADWSRRSRRPIEPMVVALTAATVFAVHPLTTEAVAWVASRSELLVAALFLTGVLAGRRALLTCSLRWIALTWLLLLLALAAKELGAMLPAVLWAYDAWLLEGTQEERRRRRRRVMLPMIGVIAALVATRLWLLFAVEYAGHQTFSVRSALLELETLRHYGQLFVWPSGLSLIHEVIPIRSLASVRTVIAVGTVAIVAVVIQVLRKLHGLAEFGIVCFLLLWLPPAALAVIIERSQLFAEHRAYLAGCGVFLCVGVAGEAVWRRWPRARAFTVPLAATVIATLAALTVARNELWSHPMLIWRDAVERAPWTFAAQYGYGRALQDDGDCERAIEYYRRAIRFKPSDEGPYQNLAVCFIEQRRRADAKAALETAMRLAPDTIPTRQAVALFARQFGTAADVRVACADLKRLGADASFPICTR
jgi:hypothetical protein